MRALDRGEDFLLIRNGRPIGELRPVRGPYFVRTADLQAAMAKAPRIDYGRLRADIDAFVDQDPTPRCWDDF